MPERQDRVRAVRWSALDVLARHGVNLLVALVLARLVDPDDFGLIAMLQLFVGLANIFIDGGLGPALIQRQGTTDEDEATVFYFNLTAAATVAAVLALLAPYVAGYYDRPVVSQLMWAMAFNVFIGAFGSIHVTLLTKRLEFGRLMRVGAVSSLISGAVGIWVAWQGLGVWSLVCQSVSASAVSVALLWLWNDWRPVRRFSARSLRRMLNFGGYMVLAGALDVTYSRVYTVLIGRFFSASELGYFWRATSTRQMISDGFDAVMGRVTFPVLSSLNGNRALLASTTRKFLMGMMFVNVPVMLGLAAVVEPMVMVLFGERWLPSAPILQVICLAGALWPLHTTNLNALTAQGRSDLYLRMEVLKKSIGLVVVIAASLHSVMAVAWAQVCIGGVAFFINAHYSKALLAYGPFRQLADVAPYFLSATGMAIVVRLARMSLDVSPAIELVLSVALGAICYVGLMWVVRRRLLFTHLAQWARVVGIRTC